MRTRVFAIILCACLLIGILPMSVHAAGNATGKKYEIYQDKIVLDGQTLTSGPISVSGGAITLTGNVFGTLYFMEGGTYTLNANGYSINPVDQNNAIDGNFMLQDQIDLTLKGNGRYYAGNHHCIYDIEHLYIESGLFIGNITRCNTYAAKTSSDKVYVYSKGNSTVTKEEYDTTTYLSPSPGVLLVKQTEPTSDEENMILNPPAAPTPPAGEGGSTNNPGTVPSNPNPSGSTSSGDMNSTTGTTEEETALPLNQPVLKSTNYASGELLSWQEVIDAIATIEPDKLTDSGRQNKESVLKVDISSSAGMVGHEVLRALAAKENASLHVFTGNGAALTFSGKLLKEKASAVKVANTVTDKVENGKRIHIVDFEEKGPMNTTAAFHVNLPEGAGLSAKVYTEDKQGNRIYLATMKADAVGNLAFMISTREKFIFEY